METEKLDAFPGLPEEFVRQNAKYMRLLQDFRLLDDDFMSKVFEDKECAQLLLHIILERSDLIVQEVHGQYSIKNLQGRSIRLDILAVDQKNRAYNIEVQRSDRGASEKRARYNSSLLDANLTDAGDDYDTLNKFLTIKDKHILLYEHNAFTSHLMLDSDEVYQMTKRGLDAAQISVAKRIHLNLVLVKLLELHHLGYDLRHYHAQHYAFIKQFNLPAHFQFDVAAG